MKSKIVKGAINFITSTIASVIVIMVLNIFLNGMYLIGIPKIENVEKVVISYPEVSDETKEIVDDEHIELAVKLTGFLKYALFEKADSSEFPMITITYFTMDGKEITVSANRDTVWWKGKAHVIKEEEMFINLTEGIFYLDELVEK